MRIAGGTRASGHAIYIELKAPSRRRIYINGSFFLLLQFSRYRSPSSLSPSSFAESANCSFMRLLEPARQMLWLHRMTYIIWIKLRNFFFPFIFLHYYTVGLGQRWKFSAHIKFACNIRYLLAYERRYWCCCHHRRRLQRRRDDAVSIFSLFSFSSEILMPHYTRWTECLS